MASPQTLTLGTLLRRYRMAAGLTQEALAANAGLSVNAISAIERGVSRAPQRETIALLVQALGLQAAERSIFERAARQRETPPPAPQRGETAPVTRGHPFVGRSAELGVLDRLLGGEGPSVLLIAGEPGIGKSRLLGVTAERAEGSGWAVVHGECSRQSASEPYAPFPAALLRLLAARSTAQRRLDLHGCGWLARLLPELMEMGPLPAPTWTLPSDQECRLIFAAVGQLLANVARPAGTLLLLDDMQWAGTDALALLAALIHDAPDLRRLRVIAAYRQSEVTPRDALAALEADLARTQVAGRLALGPLARDEAATLLDTLLHDDRSAVDRERVLRLTGGVPFFVLSMAQELAGAAGVATTANAVDVPGPPGAIPWSVAASIQQRVAALSATAQEVVTLVAIAGTRAPRRVVLTAAEALGRDEAACVAAFDEAVRARLLAEAGEDAYTCAHDLIREAVVADLTAVRRRFSHRLIAEALERLPEPQRAHEYTALAWHFAEAREPARALPYALQAGDQAQRVYAYSEAEEQYHLAANLAHELGDRAREAEALDKRGVALLRLARFDPAQRALEEGIALYRAAADVDGVARAVAHLVKVHTYSGTHQEGIALAQAQIVALTRGGVSLAPLAALHLALSSLYHSSREFEAMLAAAERASELARAADDRQLLARAAWQRAFALRFMNRLDEAVPAMEDAVPLLEAVGDGDAYFSALANLTANFLDIGDLEHSRLYLDRALAAAEQFGDPRHLAWQALLEGERAFELGQWSAAQRACERVAMLASGGATSWGDHEAAYLAELEGTLCMAQGQLTRGEDMLIRAATWGDQRHDYQILRRAQAALAERELLAGEVHAARDRLEPVLVDLHGYEEVDVTRCLPLLAWARLELGDHADADRIAAEALARVRAGHSRIALADALRVRALVATRLGRWPEAEAALDEALAVARAFPQPYTEAKALYVYGLLHVARGDPERARERLAAALAICERLGEGMYRPLVERALVDLDAAP